MPALFGNAQVNNVSGHWSGYMYGNSVPMNTVLMSLLLVCVHAKGCLGCAIMGLGILQLKHPFEAVPPSFLENLKMHLIFL